MDDEEYVREVFRRADEGSPEAIYEKGALFDLGEFVEENKEYASELFKIAADKGHAHSMWIHACELLWGLGSYPQSIEEGLRYLEMAIENKSGEACITKAGLYRKQEFGFTSNEAEVNKLRAMAKEFDETLFDPYA
ncbi:MAG: hypothetical protein ABW101_08870 [Candidatus Thiodiazotropha sp.]